MQVLESGLSLLEPRYRQSGDHTLLDFGSGPSLGDLFQPADLQLTRIVAALLQVNSENVAPLFLPGQVDEENFVEAALADHLRWKQIDSVGRRRYEQSPSLLLHPGEKEREHATQIVRGFAGLGREAHLDFVEPGDRRRHRLEQPAGFHESSIRRAMPARESLDHVDPIQRQAETTRNGFDRETLAAAGHPHDQHTLGNDLGRNALSLQEKLAPLE